MCRRLSRHSRVTPSPKLTRLELPQSERSLDSVLSVLIRPRRTSRSKRKLDMKNAAGRKGTVEEEAYILTSWAKLSTRLISLEGMISSCAIHVPHFQRS
jgi:hypothetical protein